MTEEPRKTLLFVDDERAILDSYGRTLHGEAKYWTMYFAESAEAALEIASTCSLDVIVTDMRMAGKDGLDLIRALRANKKTSTLPVIVVTGDREPTLKRRALDLGATDLLNKPIRREELIARIRSSLRLKAYQDQLEEQVTTLDTRVKARTAELRESHREMIWRLAKANEYRDDETGNHVVRVGCYSRAISEGLGMDREYQECMLLASSLHDLGKIGIPDAILLKPGALTPEEWALMQRHCKMGGEILATEPTGIRFMRSLGVVADGNSARTAKNPLLKMAATIARHHHEKWDGSGYPDGLSKTGIPLEARIVALADVFDALTSQRPYKPAYAKEKALEIVLRGVGRHFDPDVVAAFERSISEIGAIREGLDETQASWLRWEA